MSIKHCPTTEQCVSGKFGKNRAARGQCSGPVQNVRSSRDALYGVEAKLASSFAQGGAASSGRVLCSLM